MDSNAVEKSPKEIIEDLQRQLVVEKNRNRTLVEELKQLRDSHARIQIVTENEEEYITNKFMKYLNQLKKEKEELALKVEQEEEYLTNTLQKKMLTIMKEKVDLENQLEQEEEFIVNKLQKQIQEVMKDKKILEKRLEQEINDHRSLLKLEDEVIILRDKIKELEGNGGNKKEDIDALKAENFVLGQKIIREQEKLTKVNSENTKLMSNLEIDDERNFNINSKSKRNRSISFPSSISPSTSINSSATSILSSSSSSSSSSINNSSNNNNNCSKESNIPLSPLSCSSSSSCSSNNSSLNNSCNISGCSTSKSNGLGSTTGVPITRSRSSSSSNSNPCLISKVLKEGWVKRKTIISNDQELLEKRYYEISTNGEMKEYIDENKNSVTSFINLDTVYQIDIINSNHPGYSDIKLQIQTNSTTKEIIILSTYTDDCIDWKNQISSLMPSKR